MKRSFALCLVLFLLLNLCACSSEPFSSVISGEKKLRLADFVGVWTNDDQSEYYRFTPNRSWYLYLNDAQVARSGAAEFDGTTFTLTDQSGETTILTTQDASAFENENGVIFHKTEDQLSLTSSDIYRPFFQDWYEEANLNGNVLSILDPDLWLLTDPEENRIAGGHFIAYVGEERTLYLYQEEEDAYFGRLLEKDGDLYLLSASEERATSVRYASKEDSQERSIYFLDKRIRCDYELNSGFRLLRNGGAVYNDAHDYKRGPASCRIDLKKDLILPDGSRDVEILIQYDFKRIDIPIISGTRMYNSVRFSQYDYYTGEVFSLDDSTGNAEIAGTWKTSHEEENYSLQYRFSSEWQYLKTDDVFVRFLGTYHLTMPQDYDGFVFCLRPVYHSYSTQISASISLEEGTKALEDLGDDVDRAIFCRLGRFAENYQ